MIPNNTMTPWTSLITRPAIIQGFGIMFVFTGLFAGKYSLDRFFSDASRTFWLEIRLWCMVASIAISIYLVRKNGWKRYVPQIPARFILVFLFLTTVYLAGNLFLLGTRTGIVGYWTDILTVFVGSVLIIFFFRTENDLHLFALASEVTGVMLFLFCLMGFGNPDINGHGWAPFGGPITFYRIQFLTFCSAFYLFMRSQQRTSRLCHLGISAIGLYSTFASLSQTAFVGFGITILYLFYWLFSVQSYKPAVFLALLTLIVTVGFSLQSGSTLRAVMADRDIQGYSHVDHDDLFTAIYSPTIQFDDVPKNRQKEIESLWYVYRDAGAPDYRKNLPDFIRFYRKLVVVSDKTSRIQMASEAIHLFKAHKVFGAGIGNYSYTSVNTQTKEKEAYRYPHNILLEVLSTAGLIGFFLFSATLFITGVTLQRTIFHHHDSLYFGGYIIFILITALFAGDYYDFRLVWFVALIVLSSLQDRFADIHLTHPEYGSFAK